MLGVTPPRQRAEQAHHSHLAQRRHLESAARRRTRGPDAPDCTAHLTSLFSTPPETAPDATDRLTELVAECGLENCLADFDPRITPETAFETAVRASGVSAAGPDNLPMELYKRLPPKTVAAILALLWEALAADPRLPDDTLKTLMAGTVTMVYKGAGDPQDPGSYRPITVLNADIRLLMAHLAHQLEPLVNDALGHSQHAFLPGRSMELLTLQLQLILTQARGPAQGALPQAGALLLDFAKAYDRMAHASLHTMLTATGAPAALRRTISASYAAAEARVRLPDGSLSRPISKARGLHQGDPLSPLLFIICAFPIRALEKRRAAANPGATGICVPLRLTNKMLALSTLQYADDTTLLFRSWPDLKGALASIATFNSLTGAALNEKKCKLRLITAADEDTDALLRTAHAAIDAEAARLEHAYDPEDAPDGPDLYHSTIKALANDHLLVGTRHTPTPYLGRDASTPTPHARERTLDPDDHPAAPGATGIHTARTQAYRAAVRRAAKGRPLPDRIRASNMFMGLLCFNAMFDTKTLDPAQPGLRALDDAVRTTVLGPAPHRAYRLFNLACQPTHLCGLGLLRPSAHLQGLRTALAVAILSPRAAGEHAIHPLIRDELIALAKDLALRAARGPPARSPADTLGTIAPGRPSGPHYIPVDAPPMLAILVSALLSTLRTAPNRNWLQEGTRLPANMLSAEATQDGLRVSAIPITARERAAAAAHRAQTVASAHITDTLEFQVRPAETRIRLRTVFRAYFHTRGITSRTIAALIEAAHRAHRLGPDRVTGHAAHAPNNAPATRQAAEAATATRRADWVPISIDEAAVRDLPAALPLDPFALDQLHVLRAPARPGRRATWQSITSNDSPDDHGSDGTMTFPTSHRRKPITRDEATRRVGLTRTVRTILSLTRPTGLPPNALTTDPDGHPLASMRSTFSAPPLANDQAERLRVTSPTISLAASLNPSDIADMTRLVTTAAPTLLEPLWASTHGGYTWPASRPMPGPRTADGVPPHRPCGAPTPTGPCQTLNPTLWHRLVDCQALKPAWDKAAAWLMANSSHRPDRPPRVHHPTWTTECPYTPAPARIQANGRPAPPTPPTGPTRALWLTTIGTALALITRAARNTHVRDLKRLEVATGVNGATLHGGRPPGRPPPPPPPPPGSTPGSSTHQSPPQLPDQTPRRAPPTARWPRARARPATDAPTPADAQPPAPRPGSSTSASPGRTVRSQSDGAVDTSHAAGPAPAGAADQNTAPRPTTPPPAQPHTATCGSTQPGSGGRATRTPAPNSASAHSPPSHAPTQSGPSSASVHSPPSRVPSSPSTPSGPPSSEPPPSSSTPGPPLPPRIPWPPQHLGPLISKTLDTIADNMRTRARWLAAHANSTTGKADGSRATKLQDIWGPDSE